MAPSSASSAAAPSSTSSAAAPARASSRKRNPPAKYQGERPRKRPLPVRTQKLQKATKTPRKKKEPAAEEPADDDVCAEEPDEEELALAEQEEAAASREQQQEAVIREPAKRGVARPTCRATSVAAGKFVGEPFPADEARCTWPKRYQTAEPVKPSRRSVKMEEEVKARCHYRSANIEGTIYSLDDDVYVKAGEKEADYIGRITELFEGTDTYKYFTCRWYYRPQDTVITGVEFPKDHKHDPKRVFLSKDMNDNVLDCIISKVKIVRVDPCKMGLEAKNELVAASDLYYDMLYTKAYSEFSTIPSDINENSGISSDADPGTATPERTVALLDLYSGCGGMSTGLCLGAAQAGLKLETKWAVDLNSYACKSFKYNHPRTEVRNEKADHFLALLKEWAVLCDIYVHSNDSDVTSPIEDDDEDEEPLGEDEFVVEKLLEICYGGSGRKDGIYFKVQWKGYGPEEDTWEPIDNLSDCPLKIKEFVQEGHKLNILPLPGDVDVICGGPPCQGISGFNRHRHFDKPLGDEKNQQMITYMHIVSYLRPKYILMENVVDLLKFADGYLGRYALSHLVALNYQARMGMMVAGSYGLPQYRMRVFIWGALPSMVLPKFPLPTHEVVVRGGAPNAFSESVVAYDEEKKPALKKALVLGDAISDLPKIENSEALVKKNNTRQKKKQQTDAVVKYGGEPKTDFQCYIRLSRKDLFDSSYDDETCAEEGKLLDHQPLILNQDDYDRVLKIPYSKGANFRDLEGVMVGPDNTVQLDPNVKRVLCKSGKPLVPDYALKFMKGRSLKPFGRLSMDETVPTVVTRAEPHNQIILHPDEARVLSVRENARLQGFPDYYRMNGPIKEKYIQVGNAVAVPVARALGFSLARALQGRVEGTHPSLFVLPPSFPNVKQTKEPVRASTVPAAEVVEK